MLWPCLTGGAKPCWLTPYSPPSRITLLGCLTSTFTMQTCCWRWACRVITATGYYLRGIISHQKQKKVTLPDTGFWNWRCHCRPRKESCTARALVRSSGNLWGELCGENCADITPGRPLQSKRGGRALLFTMGNRSRVQKPQKQPVEQCPGAEKQ